MLGLAATQSHVGDGKRASQVARPRNVRSCRASCGSGQCEDPEHTHMGTARAAGVHRESVAPMSYDLAVWVGEQPASDAEASAIYQRLMDDMESGVTDSPPSPRIAAFVEALLARWPDITEDGGEDSPWADGPMIGNAFGDAIYFSMVWSRADEASAFAAGVAREHELVCFDPQSETLLGHVDTGVSKPRRSWFRRTR